MHTIIPGMAAEKGRVFMPFGVMGGHYQATGQAHLLAKLFDDRLDLQTAIDLPRFFPSPGTNVVEMEQRLRDLHGAALEARGFVSVRRLRRSAAPRRSPSIGSAERCLALRIRERTAARSASDRVPTQDAFVFLRRTKFEDGPDLRPLRRPSRASAFAASLLDLDMRGAARSPCGRPSLPIAVRGATIGRSFGRLVDGRAADGGCDGRERLQGDRTGGHDPGVLGEGRGGGCRARRSEPQRSACRRGRRAGLGDRKRQGGSLPHQAQGFVQVRTRTDRWASGCTGDARSRVVPARRRLDRRLSRPRGGFSRRPA